MVQYREIPRNVRRVNDFRKNFNGNKWIMLNKVLKA
jgi:hypothetical protein